MKTKQYKAESKRLLDMMINSIYTHKEIFLREIISNASDAIDKLYFKSLTDDKVGMSRSDFAIDLTVDKKKRLLTISDNGIGMTEQELEDNLGTIAKSGSRAFTQENAESKDIDIIGQFGVGFYSAFMVADEVTVITKAYGSDQAFCWKSQGVEGYTIEPAEKESVGTDVILHIKKKEKDENYDEFLESYKINELVTKYSDYIRFPIRMDMETSKLKEGSDHEYETVTEHKTLNSMVPLWRKNKKEITKEEYNQFYQQKFYDYMDPLRVIHTVTEGTSSYHALMFVPSHAPYDYYTKEYEKGLQLYSKGVLIMDRCADLLPDYFSFVKGLVDSEDLSLNISREMLQHDRQVSAIAESLKKKIKNELAKMLKDNRSDYEAFFKEFGVQIKYGLYADFGMNKEMLQDLVIFYSSTEKTQVTLAEYVERMKADQKAIYYACGETNEKIDMLPQAEQFRNKGYEVLYLTGEVDEFALRSIQKYSDKEFVNICADNVDLGTEEEKEALKKDNESAKDLFDLMKKALGDKVNAVRFTNKLGSHPVCLTSEGALSLEMEKVLSSMPNMEGKDAPKAQLVLEVNQNHPIAEKLKALQSDPDTLDKYTKILYSQACLIGGKPVENPTELSNLVCELMTK